ncbi:MAG: hypothetical protein WBG50_01245 [Desulfomonilaceae bacterium]
MVAARCLVLTVVLVCIGLSPIYGQGDAPGEHKAVKPTVVDIRVEPAQPRTGDKVKIYFDLGEGTERAEVKWSLDGKEVQLSDYTEALKYVELDKPLKAGDKVMAVITPFDASGDAGAKVVRRIVCASAPPELKVVDQRIEAGVYKASVEATDPQGGQISLSLEQGPPGMTMDPKGSIDWPIGSTTEGKFPVKIKAKGENSGEAILSFEVGIRRQKQ